VTPLVDVMLVLLIIFMVAAPHLEQGVKVDLPQVTVTALPAKTDELIITITKDGTVFLDKSQVPIDQIKDVIKQRVTGPNKEVYLRADRNVSYEVVVKVMAETQKAGIVGLGIVTDPEEVTGP
jgi:biopolymer transport protein TolR